MAYALPIAYALFLWWFATGLIFFLDQLPVRTFKWSMAGGTALLAASLWVIWAASDDTSLFAVYASFTGGVLARTRFGVTMFRFVQDWPPIRTLVVDPKPVPAIDISVPPCVPEWVGVTEPMVAGQIVPQRERNDPRSFPSTVPSPLRSLGVVSEVRPHCASNTARSAPSTIPSGIKSPRHTQVWGATANDAVLDAGVNQDHE